jgi:hypothetical protein
MLGDNALGRGDMYKQMKRCLAQNTLAGAGAWWRAHHSVTQ